MDVKRPDKVHPYRLSFWNDVMSEDNTTEITNVIGILLSMMGILLKYKTCAWLGVLVAGVSFANLRANYDGKQVMSTFMLSLSAVFMCYLTNPQPLSMYLLQQQQDQQQAASAGATPSSSSSSPPPPPPLTPVVTDAR